MLNGIDIDKKGTHIFGLQSYNLSKLTLVNLLFMLFIIVVFQNL